MGLFLVFLLLGIKDSSPWWIVQTSGIDTNLRGVSVTLTTDGTSKTHYSIWASGSNGVILRSKNDGKNWQQLSIPGGDNLDFRDIESFDEYVTYVMSSGDGEKSRIYKTENGGKNWKLQYSDKRPGFFLDSLACDSETHCFALSDPVDGKFVVLSTNDGEHWKELPREKMPAALPKEGAFAASGTVIAQCEGNLFFGTGGPAARVFRSGDQGLSWTVVETPLARGNASSGVFSVACNGPDNIAAVGGDYKDPDNDKKVAAYSNDSGATWHLAETQPGGYRSAVGSFSYGDFAAVGPNGTDISHDKGVHWIHTDRLNLNAASFESTAGWAVGPKGTVARFQTHWQYNIQNRQPADAPGPSPDFSVVVGSRITSF